MEVSSVHGKLPDTHAFINLKRVSVRYGEVLALDDVSLDIPAGRVTVLIGPSGCGKSTTLRCLNGLVATSSGTIRYRDDSLLGLSETQMRRRIGYAIQSVGLMPHLTVAENVDLVPRLLGWDRSSRDSRVERLLELVRLDPLLYGKKYPHELSGGEAQRVGVARALGADPPVLLMDEPFGAVDPLTREQLQDEFIRIQRQLHKTVVFVTHDINEAIRLADYLVIMKGGRIVQEDTPEAILANPSDSFVEQFIGQDRSLLRMTLFTAERFLQPAVSGTTAADAMQIEMGCGDCYWQVDARGVPIHGYTRSSDGSVGRAVPVATHTVQMYASLKECITAILETGLPAIPVVDQKGVLCGEVRFETIRSVSAT